MPTLPGRVQYSRDDEGTRAMTKKQYPGRVVARLALGGALLAGRDRAFHHAM